MAKAALVEELFAKEAAECQSRIAKQLLYRLDPYSDILQGLQWHCTSLLAKGDAKREGH